MQWKIKIGDKFGKLTVLEQADDYISPKGVRRKQWKFQCECGNIQIINESKLSNRTMCTKCKRKESAVRKTIDYTGCRIGKLTVVKIADKPNHIKSSGIYWLCKCDCGNEIIISSTSIKTNHVKSCGKCKVIKYDLSGEYGIGHTLNGEKFLFDKEDYDLIKDVNWSVNKGGYLYGYSNQHKRVVYIHRLILNVSGNNEVDHINHNVLDNRKENIRICTKSENSMNHRIVNTNTSGETGVRWHKGRQKWESYIFLNGKYIYLGLYTDKNAAVKARKEAEEKYFGEYAYRKEKENE